MKFYFFHLMPYAELDLDYDKKHRHPWLDLPNDYFDPEHGARLYNRFLDELEFADQLGFDGICVNEHHQSAYGLMPVPGVMAGALARSTKRAKIAVLGRALPLISNPLNVAEEYAMIDNLSGGRLIAGFVRGIGVEYHVTGVNPAESLARFREAHDLIIRSWTETGPFAFEGEYYRFQYVNPWPRPLQSPHPPIWVPSQGSLETVDWTSNPARKYVYLNTFSPLETVEKYLKLYVRTAADKWGYEATSSQLGVALPLYVAETDEAARREAKPHIEAFFNKFLKMSNEMLLPPGYATPESMKHIAAAKKDLLAGRRDMETLIDIGMFVCGSPETVAEKIQEIKDRTGLEHVVAMMQFATLPHDLTVKNLEIFARQVMPEFSATE